MKSEAKENLAKGSKQHGNTTARLASSPSIPLPEAVQAKQVYKTKKQLEHFLKERKLLNNVDNKERTRRPKDDILFRCNLR